MGLLDDAIREHLDLKRRNGASEDELARKEAEALGPARRDFPRAVAADNDPSSDTAQHEQLDEPEPVLDELEPEPFAVEPELEEPPAYEPPAAQPAPEPALQPPTEEYLIEDEDEDEDEEEPLPHGDEPFLEEVEREPQAEPERPPSPEAGEEDPLEDTPDFLQETPEHDRLWFEQKPPRDFDFD